MLNLGHLIKAREVAECATKAATPLSPHAPVRAARSPLLGEVSESSDCSGEGVGGGCRVGGKTSYSSSFVPLRSPPMSFVGFRPLLALKDSPRWSSDPSRVTPPAPVQPHVLLLPSPRGQHTSLNYSRPNLIGVFSRSNSADANGPPARELPLSCLPLPLPPPFL